jgi:hypothetical protein
MNKIDKFVSPNAKLTNAGQRPPEQNQGGPTAFGEASWYARHGHQLMRFKSSMHKTYKLSSIMKVSYEKH